MAVSPTEIVFSPEQQSALLGHAVTDEKIFVLAQEMGVTSAWFYNANHQSIWTALAEFFKLHHRHPTMEEFRSTSAFKMEEARVIASRLKSLDQALDIRKRMGFESIAIELREWAKGQIFVSNMEAAADLYKRHDVAAAYAAVTKMTVEIDRVDQQGLVARCQSVPDRLKGEREEREASFGKAIPYGVTFLDEATGGINESDVVLIGAKAGVGKTQLAAQIAANAAAQRKRVVMFALEAEPKEIERRIKFGLLSAIYRQVNPESAVHLNYRECRQGGFKEELGPYEDGVDDFMDDAYRTLETIYKGYGEFDIGDLERDILRKAPDTDMFIIDHLHYIDIEGENENREMKQIVKTLRDLALYLKKPIVIVAHLRKNTAGRKNAPLVPEIEDFHGSSDVFKIATQAIMLAPCYENYAMFPSGVPERFCDLAGVPKRLWMTYIRVCKMRIDGSITRYCGVAMYNDDRGKYEKEYAVGRLTSADTIWDPEEHRPYWAKNGTLHLQSTNDA